MESFTNKPLLSPKHGSTDQKHSPTHTPVPDKIIWPYTKHGNYSSKSGYILLSSASNNNTPTNQNSIPQTVNFKAIWKLKCPPEIRLFLWKVANNGLSTFQRLHRLHLTTTNNCPICNTQQESEQHLIFDCPNSKVIWQLIMTHLKRRSISSLQVGNAFKWYSFSQLLP